MQIDMSQQCNTEHFAAACSGRQTCSVTGCLPCTEQRIGWVCSACFGTVCRAGLVMSALQHAVNAVMLHMLAGPFRHGYRFAPGQLRLIGMWKQRTTSTAVLAQVLFVVLRLLFRRRSQPWSSIGPSSPEQTVLYCCHITQRCIIKFDASCGHPEQLLCCLFLSRRDYCLSGSMVSCV